MKTSIATISIAGDLQDKLSAIARAGFDGVEIFEQDFIIYDGTPGDVGALIRDHGLSIDLFQPACGFEGLPEPQRSRAFDRIERMFDIMQELGTDLLLVSSSANPVAQGEPDRIAADFRELGERAAARNLRIGYEAVAWGRHVTDYRSAWDIVQRTNHPNIGLILDSFHTLAAGTDIAPIRSIPGNRIFHMQLSDAPMIAMDLQYLSRHFRCMPGEGDLPVSEFARAVVATGYDGPVSLEIMNDQFRSGIARIIAEDGHRSLTCLMDEVRQTEPAAAIGLPILPERGHVAGVEFIEFTANDDEAETLEIMLHSLGFAPVGQHIAKRVTVWRQGGINIVINTEQEGFAHSAYVMHGTSVCDIGLMVSDAKMTMSRAKALGANVFSQRHGSSELDIPAVRGVGGSVLHFLDHKSGLDQVWNKEFRPLASRDDGAGLIRVDHIAQTMNHDEMLTWTLFYLSILDLEKTAMVDVSDPGGVVHSRAIQSADGKLRITMNGVETHRTFAGRFMADQFGSSVQHLAFATDDIFTTAGVLTERGFRALPISGNYYLDLSIRFNLDDDFVAKLKAHNLLYDQDKNGAYLQLYSLPYGDGFFFEIVERRRAYAGYGAANASYRTALQKRFTRADGIPRK
ncbi:MAG: bifunctional sugar phosphate isomerase/epimerase/4-hydroxyphenylpyruvate dioxygenase family protein [Paracoccus sp. (in: a-proteobacteria)]